MPKGEPVVGRITQLSDAPVTPGKVRFHHWERQLAAARREGYIAGLEKVLEMLDVDPFNLVVDIRAEIARVKAGAPS